MKKLLLSIIAPLLILFAITPPILASEGIFELRNIAGNNSRCYVFSNFMEDLKFHISMSCRDIIYPGGADFFNYSVWANPLDGKKPFHLGSVGLGKAQFLTETPFGSLFITQERGPKPKSPSVAVVMQGGLQKISFLDGANAAQNAQDPNELSEAVAIPTPGPVEESGLSRIAAAGGVLAFVGLFVAILVLFIITRK